MDVRQLVSSLFAINKLLNETVYILQLIRFARVCSHVKTLMLEIKV